ncbi:MAG: phosphate ABC transporter permease subunit PstC [Thermoplasmata archaeon]
MSESSADPTVPAGTSSHRGAGWTRWLASPAALVPLVFLTAVVAVLLYASHLQYFGLSFWGPNWNPNELNPSQASYGVLYFAAGTAITSAFAVFFAMLLSLGLAISLVFYLPGPVARVLTLFVDLLAGIPSVVYGIWGYVVLAPYFTRSVYPGMVQYLGWIPGFSANNAEIAGGTGILLAIIILTLMVVPLTTALVRDSLRSVPKDLEESGLALGGTRWEVVRRVYLPHARRGIYSAVLLGLGRALGETVAVFMVIGNEVRLPPTIYSGASTIATLLVGQFDASFAYPDLLHALIEIALVLFLITLAVNLIGRRAFAEGGITGVTGAGTTSSEGS